MDLMWFEGAEPRSDGEARFLDRLRHRAREWNTLGVRADASASYPGAVPLILVVVHPLLAGKRGLTSLHIGFFSPAHGGLRLLGEWGDDYLLDNGGDDADLHVQGVSGEPEFFADLAGSWIESQLSRRLEESEWLSGSRVVARRIRLGDGGQVLVQEGSWLRRRRRPDRTHTLAG